uniref:Uncharacterized protein n=1 Tax=Knipowitschia caucasica TaxID=637954 RepID=A0AAV2JSI1_KNICA
MTLRNASLPSAHQPPQCTARSSAARKPCARRAYKRRRLCFSRAFKFPPSEFLISHERSIMSSREKPREVEMGRGGGVGGGGEGDGGRRKDRSGCGSGAEHALD